MYYLMLFIEKNPFVSLLLLMSCFFFIYGILTVKKTGFLAKWYDFAQCHNSRLVDNVVAFGMGFMGLLWVYLMYRGYIIRPLFLLYPLIMHSLIFFMKYLDRRVLH